jgi:exopolysaccharide biosynthesis protein
MKRSISCILLGTSLFLGAGCTSLNSSFPVYPEERDASVTSTAEPSAKQEKVFTWTSLQEGIARGEQTMVQDGWNIRLIVYRFDPKIVSFHLANADQAKSIRAWRDDLSNALFIINGVYFMEDGTPSGSLRIDGVDISSSAYDADKSGMFEFDGSPSIIDTALTPNLIGSATTSAQSYPFLIKDGDPFIKTDSGQTARRSFIGTDDDGFVYLGAYPDGDISLFELSKLLAKLPIEWKHVLNLDGGPSTSFFSRISSAPEIEDGYSAIPNVIFVEE